MAESEQGHRIRVGLFDKNVEEVFSQALKKILPLLRGVTVPEGEAFRWETHPQLAKALQEATKELKSDLKELFKKAVEQEYNRGLQNKISAQNEAFGPRVMRTLMAQQRVLMEQRGRAVNSYLQRVNTGNFSLARRIWKIGEQARADMATAIKAGLEDGLDYRQLARNVKEFLIEPNRLYRRVRGKDGMLHLSKAAKEYHPGQGVYRSSVRNAQRVARTETNIAYRRGELDSAQGDPFVLGIRVNLSANHTTKLPNGKTVHFFDICDELSNQNYPKDFKFTGWHPHCRCYITYIMVPQEEAMEMIRRGLRVPPYSKPITDTPEAFKEWLVENRSRLEKSTNLPYFIRENQKYISGIKFTPEGMAQIQAAQGAIQKTEPTTLEKAEQRHAARTPEQIAETRKRWADRARNRKHAQGVLSAVKDVLGYEDEKRELKDYLDRGWYYMASRAASDLRKLIKGDLSSLKELDAKLDALKKFDIHALRGVNDAVGRTLAKKGWDIIDIRSEDALGRLKKGLEYEINWVSTKGTKYPTWELARDAYKKRLRLVEHRVEMLNVRKSIEDRISFLSGAKSKAGERLLDEFEILFGDDRSTVQALRLKAKEIQDRAHRIELQRARTAKGAAVASGKGLYVPKSDEETKKDFEDYLKKIGAANKWSIDVDRGFIQLSADKWTYEGHHQEIYKHNNIESSEEHRQLWSHKNPSSNWHIMGGYVRTSNSFRINEAFRKSGIVGPIGPKESAKLMSLRASQDDLKTIRLLDKKVASFSLPVPIRVTRYVQQPALDSIFGQSFSGKGLSQVAVQLNQGGAVIKPDPAFLSASTNEALNVFTYYDAKFEIEVPPGMSMYFTDNYDESEVIFPRSSKMVFISARMEAAPGRRSGQLVIRCQLVN